jgi:hypothetical protein
VLITRLLQRFYQSGWLFLNFLITTETIEFIIKNNRYSVEFLFFHSKEKSETLRDKKAFVDHFKCDLHIYTIILLVGFFSYNINISILFLNGSFITIKFFYFVHNARVRKVEINWLSPVD